MTASGSASNTFDFAPSDWNWQFNVMFSVTLMMQFLVLLSCLPISIPVDWFLVIVLQSSSAVNVFVFARRKLLCFMCVDKFVIGLACSHCDILDSSGEAPQLVECMQWLLHAGYLGGEAPQLIECRLVIERLLVQCSNRSFRYVRGKVA